MSSLNENNQLKLKKKSPLLILNLESGATVAVPVSNKFAKMSDSGARVLEIMEDGAFTAHWFDNYNDSGDFWTELMRFDNNLVMDKMDLKKRNQIRKKAGLMPIDED